jgi:hypothetical protein
MWPSETTTTKINIVIIVKSRKLEPNPDGIQNPHLDVPNVMFAFALEKEEVETVSGCFMKI